MGSALLHPLYSGTAWSDLPVGAVLPYGAPRVADYARLQGPFTLRRSGPPASVLLAPALAKA